MPASTSRPRHKSRRTAEPGPERLQKILAAAGLGSRRQCESLILEGRVEVDRKVVAQLGAKADPTKEEIRVDGKALPRTKKVYYLVHKPPGVLSTNHDPAGRPRVVDLLAPGGERLFTVGRLDMSSEGLILATNDGELANLLTHPRYGVHKTYHVEVAGAIERAELEKLEAGMYLAEGFARVVGARIKSRFKKSTLLEITLSEGKNREIRRLLARSGHKVMRLRRVAIGPLRLGEVPLGASRPLTHEEVKAIWNATSPAARREREAEEKTKSAAKPDSTAAADHASTETGAKPAHTQKPVRPEQPMPRREKRAAPPKDDEPEQFRLPRGQAIGGMEPQRRMVIGGDSSTFIPREAGAARKKPVVQAVEVAQPEARVPAKTGGRKKFGRRPKPTGRPKRAAQKGAATRVKRRGAGRGGSGA